MHFPRFVLKGIFIGAALCFPSVALADKNDHAPAVHGAKAFTLESKVKSNSSNQQHAKNNVNRASTHTHSIVAHTFKSLPKKAKKPVKTITKPFVQNKTHGIGRGKVANQGIGNRNSITNKGKSAKRHLPKRETTEKSLPSINPPNKKSESTSIGHTNVILGHIEQRVRDKKPVTIKISKASQLDNEVKKDRSSSKHSLPHDTQIITTSQGGSNSTNNNSKDRSNSGTDPVNLKGWLEWDKYRLPIFNQSFIARSYELSNQWTNAPPIQPPKSFLFLSPTET